MIPCPPLLFVLAIEALACYLRASAAVSGVRLPGTERDAKISLYADDTALVFPDPRSLPGIQTALNLYAKASGAKINLRKSQGILLNQPPLQPQDQLGYTWLPPDSTVEYLGVPVGTKVDSQAVWNGITEKVSAAAACWKRRPLSFQGRVLVAKTVLLPKTQYLAFALPSDPQALGEDPVEFRLERQTRQDLPLHPVPSKRPRWHGHGEGSRFPLLPAPEGLPQGRLQGRSPLDLPRQTPPRDLHRRMEPALRRAPCFRLSPLTGPTSPSSGSSALQTGSACTTPRRTPMHSSRSPSTTTDTSGSKAARSLPRNGSLAAREACGQSAIFGPRTAGGQSRRSAKLQVPRFR